MYKLTKGWPQHIESGAFVNPDSNPDYLAWLAEGNQPEPADVPQADPKAEAQSYLNATDWYVIRFAETGVPVPEDVTTGRAAARLLLP